MENKQLETGNSPNLYLQRPAESGSQSISVGTVATILYRRKWLSLMVFALFLGATVAFAMLQKDKYSSRMKILVRDARADSRLTAEDTKGSYTSQEVSEADINTEVTLLTSRDLLRELAVRAKIVEPANGPGAKEDDAQRLDEAIGKLEKNLQVSPVKKSNIIEVSYTAESPERAADVLKELGALYLDQHLRLHSSSEGYELFKEQADRHGGTLREIENNLAEYERANNLVAIEEQKQTALRGLADAENSFYKVDADLGENEKRVAALQSQLDKVSPRVMTQSRTIPNQASVERLNEMIVEMQNKRTQLLTKFRPDDRLVKEIDEQLRTTRAAYDAASKRSATEEATDLNPLRQKLENDLSTAKTSADSLRAPRETYARQIAQYRATLSNLENATRRHEMLKRSVKQSEENYLLYSRKAEEARITNVMDKEKISNVEIAEAATLSTMPSSPNRKMTFALGLFLAAFAGLCVSFGAEFMRDTVATPQELEALTGYPVLASLPKIRNSYYKSLGNGNQ